MIYIEGLHISHEQAIARNTLGKGETVVLANGFTARLEDNQKRHKARMATVFGSRHGFFDETGSVYARDIVYVKRTDRWVRVID